MQTDVCGSLSGNRPLQEIPALGSLRPPIDEIEPDDTGVPGVNPGAPWGIAGHGSVIHHNVQALITATKEFKVLREALHVTFAVGKHRPPARNVHFLILKFVQGQSYGLPIAAAAKHDRFDLDLFETCDEEGIILNSG